MRNNTVGQHNPHAALGLYNKETPAEPECIPGPPDSALIDGFFFRRRRERLNWRMLAAIDPDQVMKDVDIESLQEVMENVTFCDIEAEDVRYIDPNFIKLFQLAQLIIEFLLHSQEYLVDQRDEAEAELESLRGRYAKAASEQEKQEAESAAMKKELKTLRKTLYAYQLVAKLPGGLSQNNTTQAVYHGSTTQAASSVEFQRMADMIERFSTRLVDAERQLRCEVESKMEQRIDREVAERKASGAALEEMYKQERLRYERELQELKTSVHKQVNDEREALLEEKARFEEYMNRELKRKSHVGQIEDDDDGAAKRAAREPPPKQEPEEQPKPAKTDEIGAEVQRLLQQLAEQQARSQREQESTALSLAAEFDARQQDALEAVQERMAAEMERIRLTLIEQHAIAEAAKSTGSMDIPKEDPQTEDELWETVVDAMRKHTETPIQSAPWAKSLFAHPVGAIQDEKNNSSTLADQYLAERGVTSSRIYKEWGINPGIFGEYSELSMQMFAERMQDGDAMPMYKRMRSHLEKQVDSIVSVYLAKAQDPSSTISRRSSMRKASLAFSLGPAPSPNRGSTAGALRRSIQINPVQKVEVFDQSLPVVSPVKRMSFSMPAVGFAATPTASEHGRSHERRASTTTSASTATEGPDDLDVLRAQLAALRASAQSPGSAHKQSFFSNPFKKISGDIARRLFSPKADGQMPSLREEHEAANAGNEQVFEPLEQLPPSPLKKNGTPLKGFFGRIGDGGGDDDDVGIDDLEISSSSLSQEDSLLESIIDEDPIPSNQSSPQYVGTVPAKVIGQATGTAPSSSWTAPAAKGGVAGFDNDDDDDDMDIFDNLPDSDSLTEDPPAAAAGRTSVQMPRPPQPVSNTAAAKPPPPAAQGWAGPPQGVHVMDDLDDFDD
nr:Zinc finger protein dzip1 [Polyrhizophydium stewartii]